MAISLRVVLSLATTLMVLIVAATTLAITSVLSQEALRDAGERLADATVRAVGLQVSGYTGVMEDHLAVVQRIAKRADAVLPYDDPRYATGDAWGERYVHMFTALNMKVNYSYSSLSLIFDDGSLAVSFQHQDAPGWAAEGVQTWRRAPNGTQYRTTTYNVTRIWDGTPWDESTMGTRPHLANNANLSGPLTGYTAVKTATQGAEVCIWFPPSVDHNDNGNPRFALYGLCMLRNRQNQLLGQIAAGRFLDNIDEYVRGTSKTPNTELFVIDSGLLIVSSSAAAPYRTYYRTGEFTITSETPNCVTSRTVTPNLEERIGCRARAADYPYGPLQDVTGSDPAFLTVAGKAARFGKLAGENYYYISQRIPTRLMGYSMNLVAFMPESDVLGDVITGRNIAIGVTCGVLVVAIVLSFVLMNVLVSPLDDIARRMYRMAKLEGLHEEPLVDDFGAGATTPMRRESLAADRRQSTMLNPMGPEASALPESSSRDVANNNQSTLVEDPLSESYEEAQATTLKKSSLSEIRALQKAYNTMDTAIRSFTKYVPRDVVKELMASNQMCEISMQPAHCTIMFADIAGFTSMCERVHPMFLSGMIRVYFERMSRIIMAHGGLIDKFIGDAIMAVWGAPQPIDNQEMRAAVCARMLVRETTLERMKEEFERFHESINIRVGLASGEVLAGNMGSRARMSYTVIGDEVNLASRLEALNKQWGTSILMGPTTAKVCEEYLLLRPVATIAVVGKEKGTDIFELVGVKSDVPLDKLQPEGADDAEVMSSAASMSMQMSPDAMIDDDDEELDRLYGVQTVAERARFLPASRLTRRCRRVCRVPEQEYNFVSIYRGALLQWNEGEFRMCAEALQGLKGRDDVPADAFERKSVQMLLAAALERAPQPVPEGWNGVWKASTK